MKNIWLIITTLTLIGCSTTSVNKDSNSIEDDKVQIHELRDYFPPSDRF